MVVARRGFVAHAAFDDWKNYVLLLPLEKRFSKLAKEFSASDFQNVEITRVIDVVADGTLGIGDAMGVAENRIGHSVVRMTNDEIRRNSEF